MDGLDAKDQPDGGFRTAQAEESEGRFQMVRFKDYFALRILKRDQGAWLLLLRDKRVIAGLHALLTVEDDVHAGIAPDKRGSNICGPPSAPSLRQIYDRGVARILPQDLKKVLPIRRNALDLQRSSNQGMQENHAGQKRVQIFHLDDTPRRNHTPARHVRWHPTAYARHAPQSRRKATPPIHICHELLGAAWPQPSAHDRCSGSH